MLSSPKSPINEECEPDPWTLVAKNKLAVENLLPDIVGLEFTVLRLPVVYGKSDRKELGIEFVVLKSLKTNYLFFSLVAPRIIIAAIYKYLRDPMKLLWDEAVKLSTVHVVDVAVAMWELARNPVAINQIYNVVDDSQSTQGSVTNILADIFKIKVDYLGAFLSNIAKVNY